MNPTRSASIRRSFLLGLLFAASNRLAFSQSRTEAPPQVQVTVLSGKRNTPGYIDGPVASARYMNGIQSISSDAKGNLFVVDEGNEGVRRISAAGIVTTIAVPVNPNNRPAGFGSGSLNGMLVAASVTPDGSTLYVASNNRIQMYVLTGTDPSLNSSWKGYTLAGPDLAKPGGDPFGGLPDNIVAIAAGPKGDLYFCQQGSVRARKLEFQGGDRTSPASWKLKPLPSGNPPYSELTGITCDASDNVYVVEGFGAVYKISPDGKVVMMAGHCPGADTGPRRQGAIRQL